MPSVSKRVSIAWDGGIPSEDTETLVIVGNTYFVDVRIKKETGGLDWAMAGVKEWVHKGSEPPRARFTSSLNSRNPVPGGVDPDMADEGTFSELPNGDLLETGVMYDPHDGKFKSYQEVWHDLPASGRGLVLESVEKPSSAAEGPGRKVWVAMIGKYQVMVAKLSSGAYTAWTALEQEQGWQIVTHAGGEGEVDLILPVIPPDHRWEPGDTFEVSGNEWTVKEHFWVPSDGAKPNA